MFDRQTIVEPMKEKQPIKKTIEPCPIKSHEVDLILMKLKMEEEKKNKEDKIKGVKKVLGSRDAK